MSSSLPWLANRNSYSVFPWISNDDDNVSNWLANSSLDAPFGSHTFAQSGSGSVVLPSLSAKSVVNHNSIHFNSKMTPLNAFLLGLIWAKIQSWILSVGWLFSFFVIDICTGLALEESQSKLLIPKSIQQQQLEPYYPDLKISQKNIPLANALDRYQWMKNRDAQIAKSQQPKMNSIASSPHRIAPSSIKLPIKSSSVKRSSSSSTISYRRLTPSSMSSSSKRNGKTNGALLPSFSQILSRPLAPRHQLSASSYLPPPLPSIYPFASSFAVKHSPSSSIDNQGNLDILASDALISLSKHPSKK